MTRRRDQCPRVRHLAALTALAFVVLVALAQATSAAPGAGTTTGAPSPPAAATTPDPAPTDPAPPDATVTAPADSAVASADSPDDADGGKPPTGLDGAMFGLDPTCVSGTPADSLDCIPVENYDIWYDGGKAWSYVTKATGLLTQIAFGTDRLAIRASNTALLETLEFNIAEYLMEPAERVAHDYEDNVLLRFGLPSLFLLLSQAWAGYKLIQGRIAGGLSEAVTGLVIATFSAGILATPSTTILGDTGLLGMTRDLSLCVVSATNSGGCDPDETPSPENLTGPLIQKIKYAFIIQPNMILNTGRVLDDPDPARRSPCLDAYRMAVGTGPWDTASWPGPRELLRDAGGDCAQIADWNEKMTPERLLGAGLVALAAVFFFLFILMLCGGLCVAQFALAVLCCLTFFATAFGQAPGLGRAMLFRWSSGIVRALLAVMLAVVFLALYLMLLQGVLVSTNGRPMAVRFGLLDLLVLASFLFFRRARRATDRISDQLGRRLQRLQPGSNSPTASWMRPAASAGGAGFQPAELWSEGRGDIRSAMRPLDMAQSVMYWRGGRRARRGLVRGRGTPAPVAAGGGGGATPGVTPTSRAARLRARLGQTRPVRAARLGWRIGRTTAAWTVGAPVTYPRAARQASAAVRSARVRVVDEYIRGRRAAGGRIRAAGDYGRTYKRNLAAAARAPGHFLDRRVNRLTEPFRVAERVRTGVYSTPPPHPAPAPPRPSRRRSGGPQTRTPRQPRAQPTPAAQAAAQRLRQRASRQPQNPLPRTTRRRSGR